jgi:hypothetical protein
MDRGIVRYATHASHSFPRYVSRKFIYSRWMYSMFIPRHISQIAMNMFRLLKNRRHGTSIVEDVVVIDDGAGGDIGGGGCSWERKREVVITSQRAIAPPTFKTLGDDIAPVL